MTSQYHQANPSDATERIVPKPLFTTLIRIGEILAISLCVFAVYFPLTDGDIWWHLAAAREMVSRHEFLRRDPFSYTPTFSWINLHWLFQLGAYTLYRIGGASALVLGKCAITGAACVVMAHALSRDVRERLSAFLAISLGLFMVRYLVLARPIVVSMFLLALEIAIAELYQSKRNPLVLWLVLPLQILWVNTQPLFVIGLTVPVFYALGTFWGGARNLPETNRLDQRRKSQRDILVWGLVFVGMVGSCFVNPYGVHAFTVPLRLYYRIDPTVKTVFSQNVSENVPTLQLIGNPEAWYGWVAVGVAGFVVGVFILVWRRLRLEHLLLTIFFFHLGFTAQRNVLLLVFVTLPVAAVYLFSWVTEENTDIGTRRYAATIVLALALGLLAWQFTEHIRVVQIYPHHTAVSPMRFPSEAVRFLREHPVPGNIFNADRFGGYLIWKLYPSKKVFIDGRFVLRSAEFFSEYLRAYDYPPFFDTLANRYGITHALLQTSFFERYLPLARWLYHHPHWRLVFTDGTSALFVVDSLVSDAMDPLDLSIPQIRQRIETHLRELWRNNPEIRNECIMRFRKFSSDILHVP